MIIPAIEKLGGPEAVATHLTQVGVAMITPRAVRAWGPRNSVPGYAIKALWRWALEREIELSPLDFEPVRTGAVA